MTYKGKRNWRNLLKPRNPREKKKLGGMILSAVLALILVGFISLTAFFALAKFTTAKIMSKDMVPMASSQFYDINGDLISTVDSEEDRIPVSISKVPKNLQNAFLAAEDIRFYQHGGIDFKGIARAIYTYIRYDEVQGGSTITQQLAKNLYFTQEKKMERKVAEVFMAFALERDYSKNEILELYVNTIYFGNGYYCIKDASEGYFGKEPEDLTDYESTLLAGVPNAPSKYSPTVNLELAEKRQEQVVERLVACGLFTKERALETLAGSEM